MQVQLQQQQQQFIHQQQQQARQALLAHQLQHNMGGVNGMPMGMSMAQMNPAQMAAMRQGMRPVSLDMCRGCRQARTPALLAPQYSQYGKIMRILS